MNLVLDTGIVGRLCHPNKRANRPFAEWLANRLDGEDEQLRVFLPEIADYELRRKLLHLIAKGQATEQSIARLNQLGEHLDYLPLTTSAMRRAAKLWADARVRGLPTAEDPGLDGDVILAAQAESVGGTVVTDNPKHLSRFVTAAGWNELR